jgi:uncharacterized protein
MCLEAGEMLEEDGPRPPSPCVKICVLDEAGMCRGCLRTLDEIARWSSMTAAEQWTVLERVAERAGTLRRARIGE